MLRSCTAESRMGNGSQTYGVQPARCPAYVATAILLLSTDEVRSTCSLPLLVHLDLSMCLEFTGAAWRPAAASSH